MQMQKQPVVAIKEPVKDFPGVCALPGVDLEVYPGKIHALIGESDVGKSTVTEILMGIYSKAAGEIYMKGELKEARSPVQAQSSGFGVVYRDVNPTRHLSVAENFFMGQLPRTKLGIVDFKKINRTMQEVLESIHVHVDPKTIVRTLSMV